MIVDLIRYDDMYFVIYEDGGTAWMSSDPRERKNEG